jgi:hypothetical protein
MCVNPISTPSTTTDAHNSHQQPSTPSIPPSTSTFVKKQKKTVRKEGNSLILDPNFVLQLLVVVVVSVVDVLWVCCWS